MRAAHFFIEQQYLQSVTTEFSHLPISFFQVPEILFMALPEQKLLLTPYPVLTHLFTWLSNTFFAGCYGSSLYLQ